MKLSVFAVAFLVFSQLSLARTEITMYKEVVLSQLNEIGLAVNSVSLSGNTELRLSSVDNDKCSIVSLYALVPTNDPKIMSHLNPTTDGSIFKLSINNEHVAGTKVSVKCTQQAYEFTL